MAWFTRSSYFTRLTVALVLGIAFHIPARVQAQLEPPPLSSQIPIRWDFTPPTNPDPDKPIAINREGGASRNPCIAQNNGFLIGLVPPSGIGTTVAEYPTVFWYLPKTTAWGVKFVLRDAKKQEIYSTQYAFTHYTEKGADGFDQELVIGAPGMMSLTLPASGGLPPLEIGQEYTWQLTLMCDRTDRGGDYDVYGGFKRVEPEPMLARRLEQADPRQQVAIYADERLWYETLSTLIELRRTNPNDPNLTEAWNTLINSVGLNELSEDFVVQDTRTFNN
ncbi:MULTISPECIES: DUF928 domain-containing protein [unclassified Coleofasciculus]|uniref:DUF928 domain-containing protein n=1 Tax=unclassified Coleofasciculus TaxID=2692782 RepID=UPI00187F5BE6|nr:MULTISPECIES: DUF928 domain-containing protein [unclassified Coleofasciculus]MBE9128239.1 DUF928 domain-containing protein [Coleofasciculus sp. LEGE 07081]MBE9147767.1 DUF928 domain-containing protein [Coleofasciculus sp. LEGE 07092]